MFITRIDDHATLSQRVVSGRLRPSLYSLMLRGSTKREKLYYRLYQSPGSVVRLYEIHTRIRVIMHHMTFVTD